MIVSNSVIKYMQLFKSCPFYLMLLISLCFPLL